MLPHRYFDVHGIVKLSALMAAKAGTPDLNRPSTERMTITMPTDMAEALRDRTRSHNAELRARYADKF